MSQEAHTEHRKQQIGKYPHIDHPVVKDAICHVCGFPVCADFWLTDNGSRGPTSMNAYHINNNWTHTDQSTCIYYLQWKIKKLEADVGKGET